MTDLEQGVGHPNSTTSHGGSGPTRAGAGTSNTSTSSSPRRLRASSSAGSSTAAGAGVSSSTPHEGTPLLHAPPGLSQRPSYRKRALSKSIVVETRSQRYWTRVAAGVLGLALIITALVLIILRSEGKLGNRHDGHDGKDGKKKGETPDYSRLPPAQPGLRNPNYLVSGRNGAVASEVGSCSQIGVDVLKEGGTATDAAIATTICIGVTNMFSAGIGGGGFMIIRPSTSHQNLNPRCTEPLSIDFRETAPSGSYSTMFSPRPEDPDFDAARASKIGGLAVGVPGELRGLEAAYERCGGGVSWERLFAPSIELAKESKIGRELARRLNAAPFGTALSAWMLDEEDWKEMFAPDGELLKEGDTLRREAYARTLDKIAKEGAGVFYEGEMAESMAESVQAAGGILTVEDMRNYTAIVLPARKESYLNRTYYTGHYPSGGPIITHLLNVLEGYEGYADDGRTGLATHRFVEALKFAFGARTEVGDPAYIKNSKRLAEIPTRGYADRVRANITDDRTHTLEYYHPHFDIKEDHGTTHLSTVDQWGSAVSLTSTVNLLFGSRVMDAKTGVIMNDEMDDFATPGLQDAFGLRPSPFNYPEPGKRPLSSTAPLIMDSPSGEFYLSLGGSGGSRIFGAVAQVLLNLDFGYDLANAVEQPRVHDQLSPAYVSIESGFRDDLIEALKIRGHNTTIFDVNLGIAEVQAVLRDSNGKFFATSDSRKNGVPAAY